MVSDCSQHHVLVRLVSVHALRYCAVARTSFLFSLGYLLVQSLAALLASFFFNRMTSQITVLLLLMMSTLHVVLQRGIIEPVAYLLWPHSAHVANVLRKSILVI